jgi:hypothetical protein
MQPRTYDITQVFNEQKVHPTAPYTKEELRKHSFPNGK